MLSLRRLAQLTWNQLCAEGQCTNYSSDQISEANKSTNILLAVVKPQVQRTDQKHKVCLSIKAALLLFLVQLNFCLQWLNLKYRTQTALMRCVV